MMPHRNFRELRVYQEARKLVVQVCQFSKHGTFGHDFALRNQIRSASISIAANIAEGSERGTDREFIRFLRISKASLTEVRAYLDIARDLDFIGEEIFDENEKHCRIMNAMLFRLIESRKANSH